MSHLKAKIKRSLFRKLLYETLCIYEFPFNSGDRISKEKRIIEVQIKIVGCIPTNLQKVNSLTNILQRFC